MFKYLRAIAGGGKYFFRPVLIECQSWGWYTQITVTINLRATPWYQAPEHIPTPWDKKDDIPF